MKVSVIYTDNESYKYMEPLTVRCPHIEHQEFGEWTIKKNMFQKKDMGKKRLYIIVCSPQKKYKNTYVDKLVFWLLSRSVYVIKIIIGDINDFNSELYIHQQYQKMKRWTGDPFYIPVYKYAFEDVTELCEDVAMISDTFTTEIETKKRGYACAIELVDGTINLMHGIAITKYKLQTGKVI